MLTGARELHISETQMAVAQGPLGGENTHTRQGSLGQVVREISGSRLAPRKPLLQKDTAQIEPET